MFSLSAHAGPSLQIGSFYDFMKSNQSSYLKRIHNGGTSTAFVKIEIKEIFYEKNGKSREEPLKTVEGSARDGQCHGQRTHYCAKLSRVRGESYSSTHD